MRRINATVEQRYDTAESWAEINPILNPGEIGVEVPGGKFKMGNGQTRWLELPYFLPDAEVLELIMQTISQLPTGEVTQQDLTDHVNAEEPHPAYDDLPSFSSYYQNRKAST